MKRNLAKILLTCSLFLLFCFPKPGQSNPSGGVVSTGNATITSSGSTETITQTTDKIIINWSSYNIGFGQLTHYVQPSSSSIALNRVSAGNPSTIAGQLQANGNVFLINPSGILFTPSAQVNVAGFIASTLDIPDNNFLNQSVYTFSQTGAAFSYVINQGSIVTNLPGGYVALVAPLTDNEGIIVASQGKFGMGAGTTVTVSPGDSNLSNFVQTAAQTGTPGDVTVDNAAITTLIQNVVNNGSIVNAGSVTVNGGVTVLGASSGLAMNGGIIHADSNAAGSNPLGIVVRGAQAAVLAPGSVQTANNGLLIIQSNGNTVVSPSLTLSASQVQIQTGGNLWLSSIPSVGTGSLTLQAPTLSIVPGAPNSSGFGTGATANTISTGALPTNASLIFNSVGNFNLGGTISDGTGNVSVISQQGSILNGLSGTTPNILANQATFQAGSAIGAGTPLTTQVSSLTTVNTSSGATQVNNAGTLSAVSATTNNGNVSINGTGQSLIFNASTSTLSGTTPTVTFNNTGGNLILNGLTAGGNPATLIASGSITGSGTAPNLTAGTTSLSATSIGTTNSPVATALSGPLTATASNGAVNLSNSGGTLTLADVSSSGAGNNVNLSNSGGNMLIGTISSSGGINLLTTAGSILSNTTGTAPNLTATTNSTLIANNGTIGTSTNPLNVSISNGTLGVSASSTLNSISVDINGTVSPVNTLGILTGSSVPATSGQVVYNGVCLNCTANGSVVASTLFSSSLNGVNFGLLNPESQGLYVYNPFPTNLPDLWYQLLWLTKNEGVYAPSTDTIQFIYP